MQKSQRCPRCHKSCLLDISFQGEELTSVRGHQCPVGVEFARSLLGIAKSTVSTSVRVEGAAYPLLPVRTDRPVDRSRNLDVIREAGKIVVKAPIRNGQVLARNIAGTGADLIATKAAEPV